MQIQRQNEHINVIGVELDRFPAFVLLVASLLLKKDELVYGICGIRNGTEESVCGVSVTSFSEPLT